MNTQTMRQMLVGVLISLFILSLSYFIYNNYRSGMQLNELIFSSLTLSIPLALMCFSIGLIVEAWQQHQQGRLSARLARLLYLMPRLAGILIALFSGVFALDAFDTEGSIWLKIGAFLIHASPSIVMILALVFAWRREWIGSLVFGLAAIFFLNFVIGNIRYGFGDLLLFVLPMALIAALFWLNWRWREEI